ncbi:SulP family inorganic anion transporter [Dactylosporangium sp. McL0621]|uniref:SulP family inorganic anion transporter n=1 Tax=Dactylosporangium sp. McL0621 TaxID=3415678 RepID=UPI003CF69F4D
MSAATIRTELVAALTAVALLAPETVAFAQIAGVPPAQGLAAAPLCVLAYAVLGRSPRLIVGATAATAVITSAAVAGLTADPDRRARLAVALTLLTGGILLITGLLRGGFIARFLAPEALRGFLFGLAVVIVVRQAAVIVDVPTRTTNVFVRGWDIAGAVPHWHLPSLAIGAAALIALLLLETRLPRIPATLLVLAAAAAASARLRLRSHGVAHVPRVPAGVPRFLVPDLDAAAWLHLLPTAAGMALIVLVLGHGVAERVRDPDDPPLEPNRELAGLGVANLLTGAVGGLAVSGSPSVSLAARAVGGRTRWLPMVTAALVLVVGLALTPAFTLLPEPVLAAVVIMAVRPFLTVRPLRTYLARDPRAFAVAATAILGVTTLTLIPGLLIAVALSLIIFIADASHLHVSELGRAPDGSAYLALDRVPGLTRLDGVTVLRPDGQLFFANIDRLAAAVDAVPSQPGSTIVLDLSASFDLRLSVLNALRTIRRRTEQSGRALAFAHLYRAARDAVAASDLADVATYQTLDQATAPGAADPGTPTLATR